MNLPWYSKNIHDIFLELKTGKEGISREDAEERLLRDGPNKLPDAKVDGFFKIFIRQFQSPIIYVLIIASILVYLLGDKVDAGIIFMVLMFNAIIGTIQEGKAQNTLLALKKFATTNTTVVRNGNEIVIPDYEVVAGDIIVLQEGEKIPADSRIIESNSLTVDESALTGESVPVNKIEDKITSDSLQIADQKNMLFKGTHITAGNGLAVVIATGLNTEFGKISKEIINIDTDLPLKTQIRGLTRIILGLAFIICTSIFIIGIFLGNSMETMFATVVSLAVSIIPEGLPIVITLVLASGVWRMGKRNALVKKLQAVEALGQAKILAVDKTGTLTENEIVLREVFVNGKYFKVTGDGYKSEGDILIDDEKIDPLNHEELIISGKIAALGSDNGVSYDEDEKQWVPTGDPTDAALSVFAHKVGFHKEVLEKESPILSEIPFSSKHKFHAVAHRHEGKVFTTVIGAPEKILELSKKHWQSGKHLELSKEKRDEIEENLTKMYKEGLRVIAFAVLESEEKEIDEKDIKNLVFVGAYGLKDVLRSEARSAVEKAQSAGLKVIMITGDHRVTAQSIASEVGIYHEGESVITGNEIDEYSEQEFLDILPNVSVFARVTPEHKFKIVSAFKKLGDSIAMTGDGVNDAPSLVAADLGISMGKIGTEVAKEASDIVLLDDNFSSIVAAIEEGRSIYKSIKKVVLYLFSTSLGGVSTISGALLLGMPLPILPSQIVWLNFVTDGFLVVALGFEPKDDNLLKEKFKKPNKYLLDAQMFRRIIIMAIPMMIGTLLLFSQYYDFNMQKAWTISLTTLAVFTWFNAWNVRSEYKSIFQMNPFSNRYLLVATVIVAFLQIFAVYSPIMNTYLKTAPLDLKDWLIIIPIASTIVLVEEIRKFFVRRSMKKN
jgi:P-type Ca2+ transporter type 2C